MRHCLTGGLDAPLPGADMFDSGVTMRDIETIETELMEISSIPDDVVKLERIIA